MSDPTQLLDSVHRLTDWVEDNAAATHRLASSLRRHRVALWLTIVGLVLDLGLSALFIYQHRVQSCQTSQLKFRQTISQRSFQAEYSKVTGQVKGLRMIQLGSNGADQAKVLAGFKEFIDASEKYLVQIAAINADVRKHPIGNC